MVKSCIGSDFRLLRAVACMISRYVINKYGQFVCIYTLTSYGFCVYHLVFYRPLRIYLKKATCACVKNKDSRVGYYSVNCYKFDTSPESMFIQIRGESFRFSIPHPKVLTMGRAVTPELLGWIGGEISISFFARNNCSMHYSYVIG